jgi:glycosyltransferase involved in cell wall biosynthesis
VSGPERISVVIPVYDGERYLAEAIESALAQTHPPDEVIVADDGSADGSAAIARSLGATVLAGEHAGHGSTMNRGIAAARGTILAFLDADDLWPPQRTEVLLAALQADPAAGAAFGRTDEFVSPELTAEERARVRQPATGVRSPLHTTMLFRRSTLDTVGRFDESIQLGGGIEWAGRLARSGVLLAEVDEVVLRRRLHLRNMGMRLGGERSSYARILKRHLDDIRSARGETPPAGS